MPLTVQVPPGSGSPQSSLPPSEASSGGRFLSALAWTSGAKWSTQVLTWATTIVVARMLTPNDYGVVGMATLVMGVVTLVAELGIGSAVVALRVQDAAVLRQLNSVTILIGLASILLVAAGAPSLAGFFRAEQLVPVVLVLGATFVVQSAKTVPESLLIQAQRFRLLAGVETGRALSAALVTVVCALQGWGYWSLVAGYVASALLATGATVWLQPVAFERPKRDVIFPVMRVSLDVVGSRLAWYCYSNADFFVAGRVLGSTPLGIYTMAWTIATAPVDRIAATLNQVSQSFFAENRYDMEALRKQFLTMTEGIGLATMPACLGIALVADDLVATVLGPRWSAAALPLKILCLYTPLRCLAIVVPPLLLVLGESRHVLIWTTAAAIGLPFCFILGSGLGPEGIAAAWALAYPLVAFPLYARALPRLGTTAMEYVRSLSVAIGSTVGMVLGLLLVRQVLPTQWHPGSRLAVQVTLGVLAWVGTLLVFSMPTARRLVGLVRQLRGTSSAEGR